MFTRDRNKIHLLSAPVNRYADINLKVVSERMFNESFGVSNVRSQRNSQSRSPHY